MWDLLKVSFRNVGRNKRRAGITILTVFIGTFVVTGTRALLNGLQAEIGNGLARKVHGDAQIHKRGYQDSLETSPYKNLISFGANEEKQLMDDGKVRALSPRVRIMALLNHQKSQSSTPVMVTAFDSQREYEVCPRFPQSIVAGETLDSRKDVRTVAADADDILTEAVGLDGGEAVAAPQTKAGGEHQILVTTSLMRGFGAEIGDEVVLLISDRDGMQQAIIARIRGVVDMGMPGTSARMAWLDLATIKSIAGLSDEVSEVAIRLNDESRYLEYTESLGKKIPQDWVAESWLDLAGFLKDAMALQDAIFSAILVIVFTIVISAIVNTSLMTVMERTREIGTLMALGYRRRHIILLFLGEAFMIGLAGGLTGLGSVAAALLFFSQKGISYALPGQSVATVIYPQASFAFLMTVLVLSVSAALIASVIPAYRASRMRPVVALSSI